MSRLSSETFTSKRLVYVTTGVISTWFIARTIYQCYNDRWYDAQCVKIKTDRDARINRLQEKLTDYGIDKQKAETITRIPVNQLVEKMKAGDLSVVETLHSFQFIALEAHKKTNCLTNVIEEAEDTAKELDKTTTGHKGILYGIPVSIKDNIPVKGYLISRGCVTFRDAYAKDDALLVKALKAEGAIPFVRTNIPQLMMGLETDNAIYGETSNPHNASRTPGGSSGGEGALIGFGGSPLGIGSDIGGSVRIPSAYCGICGMKPTAGRLSLKGVVPFGQTIVRSCWGPMAKDVDSLVLAMRSILTDTMFNGDNTVPPLTFNDNIFGAKDHLTIGYYIYDGFYEVHPASVRAVMEAKQVLEMQGHTLVPWSPPDIKYAFSGFYKSLSGQNGCMYKRFLGLERLHYSAKAILSSFFLNPFVRLMKMFWAKVRGNEALMIRLKATKGVSSVMEWFNWTTEMKLYVQRFEDTWKKDKLDVVICPVSAILAPSKGTARRCPFYYSFYTSLYNLLDYVGGVVPVTKVTRADTDAFQNYHIRDDTTAYMCKDAIGAEGLPISVQCVTPMWREELCLRVMKQIEEGVQFSSGRQ